MKFAITAVDRYYGVFEAFVHAGWQPLKLFTVPSANILSNQQAVIGYAQKLNAEIQLSRMTERDLAELRDQGCEALILASYDWKVPDWRPYLRYAVNFHSSPLPQGSGPYPVPRVIFEQHPYWGVSCHQVTQKFDAGDVLATDIFALQADECHESLDLKIQMSAKRLAARVAVDLPALWQQAQPQTVRDFWPKPTLSGRILLFNQTSEAVLRHIRAYGATESLCKLNNNWFVVKRGIAWTEAHAYLPGSIAHVFNRTIVVATLDGFAGLIDCDPVPAHLVPPMEACLTEMSNRTLSTKGTT
jgi:methionyl-tRNA formyltransferase